MKNNIKAVTDSSKFSSSMREMIGSLMNSGNFLRTTQDESGRANTLGVPIQISKADKIKTIENIYDSTPEKYKTLSSTTYTGKTMKNENDILMMCNIITDLGYTGKGDRPSNGKTFFLLTLPKLVDEITHDSDDLKGEKSKIFYTIKHN